MAVLSDLLHSTSFLFQSQATETVVVSRPELCLGISNFADRASESTCGDRKKSKSYPMANEIHVTKGGTLCFFWI